MKAGLQVNPLVKRRIKRLKVKETVTALCQGGLLTIHATDTRKTQSCKTMSIFQKLNKLSIFSLPKITFLSINWSEMLQESMSHELVFLLFLLHFSAFSTYIIRRQNPKNFSDAETMGPVEA